MAGSSNFKQINPTEANQLSDADFAANSLTTGGVGVDATLPSPWLNKTWYQSSTFVAAFAGMMANKGYVLSDADLPTLEAVLANVLTNADGKTPLVSVAYSPTPTFPASTANGFDLVLAGNVTSSTFDTAPLIGQLLTFVIVQGVASFTFVPPPSVNGWKLISVVPNSVNVQQFIVRANGTIWPVNYVPSVPNNATGHVYNTVYQNLTGKTLRVSVTGYTSNASGGTMIFNMGLTGGLGIEAGRVSAVYDGAVVWCQGTMDVPNGWYYEVQPILSMTLQDWLES